MTELNTLPPWVRAEWERLFAESPEYVMIIDYIFTSKCHPRQRRGEFDAMSDYMTMNGDLNVYVEIGTGVGGGVYLFGSLANRVAGYDVNEPTFADLFAKNFPRIDWLLQHASSLDPEARDHLKLWLNGDTIDVLFIDGQKTGGAFTQDFNNHLPLMSPNGIVFMHDITSTSAKEWKVIEESGLYRTTRIINTTESAEAFEMEMRGVPATTDYGKWLRYWKGRGGGVGVVFLGDQ